MRIVYILTEGGKNIGFGHLTRCLSFYQVFKEKRIHTKLIINGDSSVTDLLADTEHMIMDWTNFQDSLLDHITEEDIVLIDSYLAPLTFYEKAAEAAGVAAYIDDERRFSNYPAGVLINGDIHASTFDYSASKLDYYLLGPEYQAVRQSFCNPIDKKICPKVEKILITCGGSDAVGLTPVIMSHLNSIYPDILIEVVIGKAFKNSAEIENVKTGKTELIYNPDEEKMKGLMVEADIVITAAGQTLFELAAVGSPTIAVAIFREHLAFALAWEKTGFIEYAGLAGAADLLPSLDKCLIRLSDAQERAKRNSIGRSLVDGQGAIRVANFLLALKNNENMDPRI